MNIGVLKERKRDERRVALLPTQAFALTQTGHRVWVEHGAGQAAGYDDGAYAEAGARLGPEADIYERSELLLKVKCPLPEEYHFLRPRHVLFAFLHFDENIPAESIVKLVETGVTAIAYEWVQQGTAFPLLQPMSELTGAIFARRAMDLLMERTGLLGGQYLSAWPGVPAMVIGGGHIGLNAVNVLARNGFPLTIVDKHPETLQARLMRYVPDWVWARTPAEVLKFDESDPKTSVAAIRNRLSETHIVICAAVRRPTLPTQRCKYIITRAGVRSMPDGSVICDATACDRDFIETCISSESLTQTYTEEGVIHYNCDHVPSLVPRIASDLLTRASFPFVQALSTGLRNAVAENPALAKAVMCYQGKLTHAYSAQEKSLSHSEFLAMLRPQ
ncbi:MAG: hypothetical protein ACOC8H_02250 [bacterium]